MTTAEAYAYHASNWSDIVGHLPLLRSLAKGNVMEIGVRGGVSTSALLSGIDDSDGHLWSFDINDCRVANHLKWTFTQADSIREAERIKTVIPEKLDLLFVDGDHTYEGCLSDLQNFGDRAAVILVHDVLAAEYPGVRKACEEYAAAKGRTLVIHEGSYGMGEIR